MIVDSFFKFCALDPSFKIFIIIRLRLLKRLYETFLIGIAVSFHIISSGLFHLSRESPVINNTLSIIWCSLNFFSFIISVVVHLKVIVVIRQRLLVLFRFLLLWRSCSPSIMRRIDKLMVNTVI